MSIFNKIKNSTPVANTTNNAGWPAIKQSAKLEAISLVLTSFVRDKFYTSAQDDLTRLKWLTEKVDAEFLAKLAVFARTKFGMRSITHALAGYLAPKLSGKPYAKSFYDKIVHRVDDMQEILAVIQSSSKKCVPNAVRKGFKAAFERFDAYQLAKYRTENKAIKLVDIVNLIHPKHNKSLEKLVKGELKNEQTWEAKVSAAGNSDNATAKEEAWWELILNKKLGYLALIRNLRNIEDQLKWAGAQMISGSLVNQLTDVNSIAKSLVMPFQIKTAYDIVTNRDLKVALGQAMELSVRNVPRFPGKTVIMLDRSGSMGSVIGIASLFAAVLAKSNNATIINFGTNANFHNYNPASLLADIQQPLNSADLGWTDFNVSFNLLNEPVDRIIILSDMQAWIGRNLPTEAFKNYRKRTGANPYIYSFDLCGSGTMQFPEDKVFTLAGFHGDILQIMWMLEQDKDALIREIESITL